MVSPVLFLDMDGVLCSPRCTFFAKEIYGEIPYNYLDKEATSYMLTIVRKYGFKIVVSSVWRGNPNFIENMRSVGFISTDFHVDWRTKNIDVAWRGDEIDEWLQRHPEVGDKYVIFEDEPSDLLDHHKADHLVKCDTYNGIMFDSMREFDQRIIQLDIKEKSDE